MVISPLSVSTALGLLSYAANGHTFEELKNGLHLTSNKAAIASQFLQHADLLNKNAGNATFSIANKIYVQKGYKLNKHFQEVAAKNFKSGADSLNFGNSVESAQTINRFVEQKTSGKIRNLIKPDMLTSDTRSVLVNAIHFKGKWEHEFKSTHEGDFQVTETETVPANYMFKVDYCNFAKIRELDATALEMKYANSGFSFGIILPESLTGLSALEAKLKDYDFAKITNQFLETSINVKVPKFTVEFEINLNDVLKKVRIRHTTPKMWTFCNIMSITLMFFVI